MSEENKAIVRGLYEALSAGDLKALDAGLADNLVEHEEIPGLTPDKAGVIAFFTDCMAAFEGFRMNADQVIAEGDRVAVLGTASGKHTGEFMGVPASGNQITVPLADYFRISGGKVTDNWGVMDTGSMLAQMGVLELPG